MNKSNMKEDILDLQEIYQAFLDKIFIIIFFVFLSAVSSVFYSLSLPNIYKSQAILAPASSQDGISSALSSINSLSRLAGVDLADQDVSKIDETLQRISSFEFFRDKVLLEIYLPDLLAYDAWDSQNKLNKYNQNIYNTIINKWVRDVNYPYTNPPSAQESFKEFKKIVTIKQDKDSGFITISIEHQSPLIAKEWVSLLISSINEEFRDVEKKEAMLAIDYLYNQIALTNLSDIKQVFSELVKNETQKLILIESRKDYVLKYIDPPYAPEIKSSPNRPIICILGTLMGFLLSISFVLLGYVRSNIIESTA
jgi:LPS O-antigen subunit length determinant protein (WzzB/FepE family)